MQKSFSIEAQTLCSDILPIICESFRKAREGDERYGVSALFWPLVANRTFSLPAANVLLKLLLFSKDNVSYYESLSMYFYHGIPLVCSRERRLLAASESVWFSVLSASGKRPDVV